MGRRGAEGAVAEEVVEEGAVEAELRRCQLGGEGERGRVSHWKGKHTCHVNGRLLIFTNASSSSRILINEDQLGGRLGASWRSLLRAAMTIESAVIVEGEEEEEERKEGEGDGDADRDSLNGCEEFITALFGWCCG